LVITFSAKLEDNYLWIDLRKICDQQEQNAENYDNGVEPH